MRRSRAEAIGVQGVSGAGGAMAAAAGLLERGAWSVFSLGVLLLLLAFVWSVRTDAKSERRLTAARGKEVEALSRYKELVDALQFEEVATQAARSLISGADSSWRLSIYILSPERDSWVRVLRRASDVRMEVGGRSEVPMDRSFLQRVMVRDLTAAEPQVDMSGRMPDARADWLQAQMDLGYSSSEARNLRMMTRRYGVCATRLDGKT